MAGVPTGRGCEGCRKRKKKCNLAQPSCARCTRYGIRCVGSGERVYKFKNATVSESAQSTQADKPKPSPPKVLARSPQRPLVNELSASVGAFVSTLQISDPKFSIHGFGPFLDDVPRRLGRSDILNSSAKAFSSAVTAIYSQQSHVEALKDYGAALTCMRNTFINDPSQVKKSETLCAVYLLMLSQNFLSGHNDDCLVHVQGLLYILNSQPKRERQDPFTSQMIDLVSIIVITESIIDPRVQLDLSRIYTKKTSYYGPLNDYSVVDIRSTNLTVENLINLPRYLKEPEYHLPHIRSSYELMRMESQKLIPITIQLHAATKSNMDFSYNKGYVICESSVCVLSTLMAILRRTLQIFHPSDATLCEHADEAAHQALASASRAWNFRPLGTTYMPKTLCLSWVTTDNPSIKAKLEDMIECYKDDFRGDGWIELVQVFERRFTALRKRIQSTMPHRVRHDTNSPGSTNGSEVQVETIDDV